MNYQLFLNQITKEIQKCVGSQARVRINQIEKLNYPAADGLTILLPGENTAPAIYLDPYYQEYLNGTDLSDIAEQIIAFHERNKTEGFCDLSFYRDFAEASKHIVCRLVNYEKNRTLLEKIPYQRFFDLAIVYYYRIDNSSFGDSGILVQNNHVHLWNTDNASLHAIAAQNTRSLLPFQITTLPQMLADMPEVSLPMPIEPTPSMYILTNEKMSYGAVNIIYHDILDAVAERLGCDYYILPSSIHECLLLPVSSWNDTEPQRLQKIVSEINEQYVADEEVLGDQVYRYVRASGCLVQATEKPSQS
ncbi:MAG: DUF5688 family protein [Lachnospiraceae bacterium]|nr:DUF5688 family protein [Lachnospiraceae bacterium]